jgi:hypothetical protein
VDSLCIIQDTDDCLSELPKMGDVYANADCVIAAAAAWDNSETLFTTQRPLAMSPCLVGVADQVGPFGKNFEGIYAFPDSRFTYDADQEIAFARLNSRAWCLQELKLAKRVLWFGHSQVQFICKGEGRIDSQAMFFQHQGSRSGQFGKKIDLITQKLQYGDDLLAEQWWNLVEEYTSRWVTRKTDRLSAIGGFATYFQRASPNHDYLAGLWRELPDNGYPAGVSGDPYFVMGLLWYVTERRQNRPRLEYIDRPRAEGELTYRAPSWSWASVDGIISNNSIYGSGFSATSLITVRDILYLPAPETTPRIRIAIRGVLQTATWAEIPASEAMYYVGYRPTQNVEMLKDIEMLIPVTQDPSAGPKSFALLGAGGGQVGWFLPDCEGDTPLQLHCLGVKVEPEAEEGKRNFKLPFVMRGIVLAPTNEICNATREAVRADTFRRVGFFELKRREGGILYPDLASGPLVEERPSLPARWPYPDVDPEGFFRGCKERLIWIE